MILLIPLGLITGLILGWREEAKGGALAEFSVAAFCLAYGPLLVDTFLSYTRIVASDFALLSPNEMRIRK